MPRYRRKPLTIEAFQMTEEARLNRDSWPDWVKEAFEKPYGLLGSIWFKHSSVNEVGTYFEIAEPFTDVENLIAGYPLGEYIVRMESGEITAISSERLELDFELINEHLSPEYVERLEAIEASGGCEGG